MNTGHDLRMLPAAVLAWLGLVVLVRFDSLWAVIATLVCLLLATFSHQRSSWLAFTLIAVAVVLVSFSWRQAVLEQQPWTQWTADQELANIEATAMTDAKRLDGSADRFMVRLRITRITIDGSSQEVRARAIAFITAETPLRMGELVRLRARMAEPRGFRDVATLQAKSFEKLPAPDTWWERAEGIRSAIRQAQDRTPDQAGALVPALVMGDESGLHSMTKDDFRRTGLTHLLAVSGANLTIVLAVVLGSLRLAGQRRWLIPAGLLVTVAFVLIARPEPSVQRAAVMGVVAVVGLGRARTSAGIRALSWAVLALLFLDPWLAVDYGFALSVLATGGIVLLAEPLAVRFETWAPHWLALSLAVPLAAQLTCLPVIALLTSEVSLVSLAANMLAAAAVAPATVFGLLAGVLQLLWAPLAVLPAFVAWLAAKWIITVSIWSADAVGAALPWTPSPLWLVPVSFAVLLALLRWGSNSRAMAAVTLLLTVIIIRPMPGTWLPDDAVLVACDVGQGDAFVIPVAKKEAVVIDVGEHPADIHRCLKDLRITSIPLMVLTHAHVDHTGGWRGAARGREIGTVFVGPSGADGVDHELRLATAGDSLRVAGVQVEVLWPRATAENARPSRDPNNDSLVLHITTDKLSMLFTGDIGAEVARRLRPQLRQADLVKVQHHGSADMWPGLYDLTNPRAAVIGVGADNRHGHPHPDVLGALEERGIAAWRTDELGTFAVVVAGSTLKAVPR